MKYTLNGVEVDRDKAWATLKYQPHPTQLKVHDSNSRFRFLCCGRRWGKTLLVSKELFLASMLPGKRYWIVAPTYSLAEKAFREVYRDFMFYHNDKIAKASESEMKIVLKNYTIIEGKSADNPESLLGEGLDGMIVDEAARIKDDVWNQYLRPTLADKQGWLLAISTPRGSNWFSRGYIDGQSKVNLIESWNFTTADNPYIAREEIELAKVTLPERTFRQEFLGEILSDIGGVFRGVRDCIRGDLRPYEGGEKYIIGVDLAKYQDFTVVIVIRLRDNQVVYFDRFNQIDWSLQEKKIINVWQKYGCPMLIVDATGVGDRVYEELAKTVPNIIGYQIKGSNKNELIDNLAMMIENKSVGFPEIPELINELNIYEYEMTRAGNVKLSAPDGYHDDTVIALALACSAINDMSHRINLSVA
jgi:hypothetical protein